MRPCVFPLCQNAIANTRLFFCPVHSETMMYYEYLTYFTKFHAVSLGRHAPLAQNVARIITIGRRIKPLSVRRYNLENPHIGVLHQKDAWERVKVEMLKEIDLSFMGIPFGMEDYELFDMIYPTTFFPNWFNGYFKLEVPTCIFLSAVQMTIRTMMDDLSTPENHPNNEQMRNICNNIVPFYKTMETFFNSFTVTGPFKVHYDMGFNELFNYNFNKLVN